MGTHPWLTVDQIVEQVKLRISLPISQESFSKEQIISLADSVFFDSIVPTVMSYHSEFYVNRLTFQLVNNQNRYPIPDRSIGMRLRDVWFKDTNGNLAKLTRINPDNEDMYQGNTNVNTIPYTFKVENNEIVLIALIPASTNGSLEFSYFLRPNNLVANERAFIVNSFGTSLTVANGTIADGDTVTITSTIGNNITTTVFTARTAATLPLEFTIGASSIATASNLVNAINLDTTYSSTNQTPATAVVTTTFYNRNTTITTSNTTGFAVSTNMILNSASAVPSNITNGTFIDFLQTRPGHRIYSYDVLLGANAVSGSSIMLPNSSVPDSFIVGDYAASTYESIIPQIPPELHSLLVERTCERILQAQGDIELLGSVQQKIQSLEKNQGTLIDNRVDGSPQKVINRNSIIAINKSGIYKYY